MTLLSDLLNAIEAADLPAAVYRTAVRLARLTDETKRVVLAWEEFQPLTGCTHVDAARRHLRALGDANLITWRGGTTVLLEWQVGKLEMSDLRLLVSENRHRMRVDPYQREPQQENRRPALPEKRLAVSARMQRHQRRQTVPVEKKTCAVGKQARRAGNQTSPACYPYVRARPAGCLIADPIHSENGSNQSNKQLLMPAPTRLPAMPDPAEALLLAVGVAPETAKQLAPVGFDLVRRAVASWYTQRKEAGGKYDNHPGLVIYWLRNPGKAGIPPTLPPAWHHCELGRRFRTEGESFGYGATLPSRVDVPVAVQPPSPLETPPLLSLSPTSALWALVLAELLPTLPKVAQSYLANSHLEMANQEDSTARYRVMVEKRADAGIAWLTTQASPAIRRKLASILGKAVLVDIAVESQALEAAP